MINEQVMIDTVSRMLEAGIDDATIISTLSDAGLAREEAVAILQKVKNPQSPTPEQVAPVADVRALRNEVETQAEAQEMQQTQLHNKLDLHEQKIDEVTQKVEEVKQSIISSAPTTDGTIPYKISMLEQKLEEVNSISKATLDLMQKILETDRKILTELEAKK